MFGQHNPQKFGKQTFDAIYIHTCMPMNSSGKHQGDTDVSGQYANIMLRDHTCVLCKGPVPLGMHMCLKANARGRVSTTGICDCTGGSTESALRMSWVKRARRSQQWMTLMMTAVSLL